MKQKTLQTAVITETFPAHVGGKTEERAPSRGEISTFFYFIFMDLFLFRLYCKKIVYLTLKV